MSSDECVNMHTDAVQASQCLLSCAGKPRGITDGGEQDASYMLRTHVIKVTCSNLSLYYHDWQLLGDLI